MKRPVLMGLGIAAAAVLLLLYSSLFVVHQAQQALADAIDGHIAIALDQYLSPVPETHASSAPVTCRGPHSPRSCRTVSSIRM